LNNTVLCRGYKDEPLKLVACSDWGKAVEVKTEARERGSIGFLKTHVYCFDAKLFIELRDAYVAHSQEEMEALWKKAQPYGH